MSMLKRLALAIAILVCGSLSFSAAAIAAEAHIAARSQAPLGKGGGGGGPLPAGNYVNTNLFADFRASGPAFQQIGISVNGSTNKADPLAGPSSFTSETDVSFNVFDGRTYEQGCIILSSPSNFTLGSGLLTASLHTTVTATTPTCNGNIVIAPLPLTIDVTWSSGTAVATSHSVSHYDCLTYSSETQDTNTSSNTSGAALLSPIFNTSFSTDTAGLFSSKQVIHVQGAVQADCQGQVGGKGAGSGPPPPGNYHTTTLIATMSGVASDGGQVVVNVNRGTRVSSPHLGPTTTTTQTTLFIEDTGSQPFFACFVIPDSDFSQTGVQSASLNTTVTDATPTCGPFNNPPPLPVTITATLTGTAPLQMTRSAGTFSCLSFRTESSGLTLNNNANGTTTLSPVISGAITSTFGDLLSSDSTIHVQGVDQDACIFRN